MHERAARRWFRPDRGDECGPARSARSRHRALRGSPPSRASTVAAAWRSATNAIWREPCRSRCSVTRKPARRLSMPTQVVAPALWIGEHRAIEQDDRDARGIERLRDAFVRVVLVRRQFERREEHAGHVTLDVLTAEMPRAVRLRRRRGRGRCPRRAHVRWRAATPSSPDRSARRFPSRPVPESAGRTTARPTSAARGPRAHVGARPHPPLDQPGNLQVAHRAPHRNPRRAERPHQLSLARQPVAPLQAARTESPAAAPDTPADASAEAAAVGRPRPS